MIQLTLQERITERIIVLFVVVSVPQIQEQLVVIVFLLSGADSAAHWGQIVDFPVRFFGNFLFSVEVEKFPRASSSSAGRLRQVAADRARAGEKFCRHTESVRDGKVQKQDWRQAQEQKSRAPPARPSDGITAQSHSVSGGQTVSDIQVRTVRTVADARNNDPVRSKASPENASV